MSGSIWPSVMLGIFVPLGLFTVISALVLFSRVTWPAVKNGMLWRYSIGTGGFLVSTGVAIECVLYGLVRWLPAVFGWLNTVYPLVLTPKVLYLVGVLMIQTASFEVERRPRFMLIATSVAAALWVLGTLVALAR